MIRPDTCALVSANHTLNNCPFLSLFSATVSPFLRFLLLISLLETAPRGSTEVPCSVPNSKKAEMCLTEEMCVDKLCPGINYSALGHKLHGNEATVYIKQGVFKRRCT